MSLLFYLLLYYSTHLLSFINKTTILKTVLNLFFYFVTICIFSLKLFYSMLITFETNPKLLYTSIPLLSHITFLVTSKIIYNHKHYTISLFNIIVSFHNIPNNKNKLITYIIILTKFKYKLISYTYAQNHCYIFTIIHIKRKLSYSKRKQKNVKCYFKKTCRLT